MPEKDEGPVTDGIRNAIESACAYLSAHRDQARYTDSLARARVEEGIRVRVEGPTGEVLITDMPGGVGGGGSAPSPGWYLRAAVAACVTSLALMRAAQLGMQGLACELTVDSESDDYGILGLDPSVPAGPLTMRINLQVSAAGDGSDSVAEVAQWAIDHCPVSDAIKRAVPIRIEINA